MEIFDLNYSSTNIFLAAYVIGTWRFSWFLSHVIDTRRDLTKKMFSDSLLNLSEKFTIEMNKKRIRKRHALQHDTDADIIIRRQVNNFMVNVAIN